MSKNIDNTISLLQKLGVSEEEARIYLEIVQGRGDTALVLSRISGLKRTTVYRLLDNLITKGLIVNRVGERGGRFGVSPIDSLDFLVSQKEAELNNVRKLVPELQKYVSELAAADPGQSQVLYYHGRRRSQTSDVQLTPCAW